MKLNNIGLEIIKLADPESEINVGHDQIWCGDYEETKKLMSEVELKAMEEDGWFEEEGAWSHFI